MRELYNETRCQNTLLVAEIDVISSVGSVTILIIRSLDQTDCYPMGFKDLVMKNKTRCLGKQIEMKKE